MTKKELVEFLELFPDDAKVLLTWDGLDFTDISGVVELIVREHEGETPALYHMPWPRNNGTVTFQTLVPFFYIEERYAQIHHPSHWGYGSPRR